MKAVIQRVSNAQVVVDEEIKGKIDKGFMILLGVKAFDDETDAQLLAKKIYGLRIFSDENDKINLSLADVSGAVLVISQFTLFAYCKKGNRPYFRDAEKPQRANELYEYFCKCLKELGVSKLEKGVFGADMKVTLTNDGPVTIIIDTEELKK